MKLKTKLILVTFGCLILLICWRVANRLVWSPYFLLLLAVTLIILSIGLLYYAMYSLVQLIMDIRSRLRDIKKQQEAMEEIITKLLNAISKKYSSANLPPNKKIRKAIEDQAEAVKKIRGIPYFPN